MARFNVSTGQVAATAGTLRSLAAVFDQQLEAADNAVNAVAGASWTGAASEDFGEAWQALVADAVATRAALTSIIARLDAAETTYVTIESMVGANSNAIVGAFTGKSSSGAKK